MTKRLTVLQRSCCACGVDDACGSRKSSAHGTQLIIAWLQDQIMPCKARRPSAHMQGHMHRAPGRWRLDS